MSGNPHLNWRVGHHGRDLMYYEENIDGVWHRLDVDGEMLMGRAHHVIYFASAARWSSYPEWARHRRDGIIARIKSQFREPDYEYHEEAEGTTLSVVVDPTSNRGNFHHNNRNPSAQPRATAKQRAALWAVTAILLGITGGMAWLVGSGWQSGETVMPSKRALHQRVLSRQHEPASFHAALGVYTLLGLGSGVAAWRAIRAACRIGVNSW